jgi:hypothetical protein
MFTPLVVCNARPGPLTHLGTITTGPSHLVRPGGRRLGPVGAYTAWPGH